MFGKTFHFMAAFQIFGTLMLQSHVVFILYYQFSERQYDPSNCYALQVVKETLRIANVVEFSYREAIEDVSYSGISKPVIPIYKNPLFLTDYKLTIFFV